MAAFMQPFLFDKLMMFLLKIVRSVAYEKFVSFTLHRVV